MSGMPIGVKNSGPGTILTGSRWWVCDKERHFLPPQLAREPLGIKPQ